MDAITYPPAPVNEPNLTYAPGSPERDALRVEIEKLERREHDLRAHIGGRRKAGGGAEMTVVQPHDHQHVLGTFKNSTQADARARMDGAIAAGECPQQPEEVGNVASRRAILQARVALLHR